MSKPKWPIAVKRGNVRVKIYRTPSNGCRAYTLAYYFGDQRLRKSFADLAKAELEAETVANRICAGQLNVLTLTSEDRTAYVRRSSGNAQGSEKCSRIKWRRVCSALLVRRRAGQSHLP